MLTEITGFALTNLHYENNILQIKFDANGPWEFIKPYTKNEMIYFAPTPAAL